MRENEPIRLVAFEERSRHLGDGLAVRLVRLERVKRAAQRTEQIVTSLGLEERFDLLECLAPIHDRSAVQRGRFGRPKMEDTSNMNPQKQVTPSSTRVGVPSSPLAWSESAA